MCTNTRTREQWSLLRLVSTEAESGAAPSRGAILYPSSDFSHAAEDAFLLTSSGGLDLAFYTTPGILRQTQAQARVPPEGHVNTGLIKYLRQSANRRGQTASVRNSCWQGVSSPCVSQFLGRSLPEGSTAAPAAGCLRATPGTGLPSSSSAFSVTNGNPRVPDVTSRPARSSVR